MTAWEPVGDLGDAQLNREVNRLTAAMDQSPAAWWWLSFCDPDLPAGSQFLGAALVRERNIPMAMARAWELGINPGGQVAAAGPIPDDAIPAGHPLEVLMDKNTIAEYDA